MQKLKERNTYTPLGASQAQCNCDSELNRDQSLSVQNLKTSFNNTEVNPVQQTERSLKAKVFVLNSQGKPLMPCSYAKSKKMVKKGSAKVIKRFPFTIQLNFKCENKVQEVNLGIDTGFGIIGFSVTSEKEELFSGTLILDGKTKERLDKRRMYRRGRRARHHWYRKPRFLNRQRKKNWLPPSIERRYLTHLRLIEILKKVLPITNVILEIAKFDIQKLQNPDIGEKEYQQGNLYDYQNVVSYLKTIQGNVCLLCKNEFKSGESKVIHHIFPRGDSRRTNRVKGLVLLHKKCHTGKKGIHNLHKEKILQNIKVKKYEQSTFMSIINKRFWNDIPDLKVSFGIITFVDRNKLGLKKTHLNDAFVISKGTNQKRCKPIEIIQKHRNNRVLQLNRKGFKPSIKKEKSKVSSYDILWIESEQYICKGMFNKGKYITFGSTKEKAYFKFSDVTKVFHFGSFAWNM